MTQIISKQEIVNKTRKVNSAIEATNAFKVTPKIPVYEVNNISDNHDEMLSDKFQRIYDSAIQDKREANILHMKSPGMTRSEKIENITLAHIKYKIACAKFKEVVDRRPDFFKSRMNLSYCFFRLKNYEDALMHCIYLEENTKKSVRDYDKKMAALYDNMGDIYLVQTDLENINIEEKTELLEKARECFSRSLKHDPENEYVLVTLLMVYCLQGKEYEAISLLYYSDKVERDFSDKVKKMLVHNPVTKSILMKLYEESDLLRKIIKAEVLESAS